MGFYGILGGFYEVATCLGEDRQRYVEFVSYITDSNPEKWILSN